MLFAKGFLDLQLEPSRVRPFSSSLAEQSTLAGLEGCFPFPVLTTQLPIRQFYGFYEL